MSKRNKNICPGIQTEIQAAFDAPPNTVTGLRPVSRVFAGLGRLWRYCEGLPPIMAQRLETRAIIYWAERLCVCMCAFNRPKRLKLEMLADRNWRMSVLAELGGHEAFALWERRYRQAINALRPSNDTPREEATPPLRLPCKRRLQPKTQIRFRLPFIPQLEQPRPVRAVTRARPKSSIWHAAPILAIVVTPEELRGETDVLCLADNDYHEPPDRPFMTPFWSGGPPYRTLCTGDPP